MLHQRERERERASERALSTARTHALGVYVRSRFTWRFTYIVFIAQSLGAYQWIQQDIKKYSKGSKIILCKLLAVATRKTCTNIQHHKINVKMPAST